MRFCWKCSPTPGMGTMVGGLASAQFLNVSPVSKFAAKLIENR